MPRYCTKKEGAFSTALNGVGSPQAVYAAKRYKPVANRVKPVRTTLPEEHRIIRLQHPDPLRGMPQLPTRPPAFTPGLRYTLERRNALQATIGDFLWPEEEKLAHELVKLQEQAFAWEEIEKGRFKDEYFAPILIPTIEHIPWALRNIPIPPGIYDRVINVIREKMAAGVYEPSSSSYRSRWFCVPKKDGKSLRLVHDLQPLNQVTIADSGLPPMAEQYAESFGARACYGSLDLFVSFDQRSLDERSRDLTTFQSPLGTLRLTSVPMGYTNAMQIMHGDVTHILQDEIPDVTAPFVDDVPVKGPKTRYELPNGKAETIPENDGIRRFVWEHLNTMNRILQRMKAYGGTFNGKKLVVCAPETLVVGHLCCYEGRKPDQSYVQKIKDWPACRNVSEIRSFLGTCGVLRIFIKDYAKLSRRLVNLTRKDAEWIFGEEEIETMNTMKKAVIDSPALRAIDYECGRPVILAVDSSYIAAGFVLLQVGEDEKRYPARFGSIPWNERESRYSQAKLELYGLFRALRAFRLWLIGLPKFTVETDAKYIKGMLNNPDIQPNAVINRWIAGILLFDFDLVHVPGDRHTVADGLSRRPPSPDDLEDDDDFEEWIDQAHGFAMELLNGRRDHPRLYRTVSGRKRESPSKVLSPTAFIYSLATDEETIPRSESAMKADRFLLEMEKFLRNPIEKGAMPESERKRIIRRASGFFILDDKLWRRKQDGRHQLVLPVEKRLAVIQQAHDNLGHKGVFVVSMRLSERFWWPALEKDVKWFTRTCHQCQVRQFTKIRLPPTVPAPAALFRRAYMDTMSMPKAGGYKGIVQARCSLSAYPEARRIREETGEAIAAFIFEDILCRWGAVEEIVTDNGSPFVKALDILGKRYRIFNIRISAYNSRANGIVERSHRPVREATMKAVEGVESKWPSVFHSVIWAERVTIQRSTGYSPYRIAHGTEPLFPFDLAEATYLAPPLDSMDTVDLLAVRARQLQKREEDLRMVEERVLKARYASVRQFLDKYQHTIRDFDFKPGSLVLVRNSAVELELNRKSKPRYLGPMIVVKRTARGAYVLAELDGAVAKTSFAAFRVVPYHARQSCTGPIPVQSRRDADDSSNVIREADEEADSFREAGIPPHLIDTNSEVDEHEIWS